MWVWGFCHFIHISDLIFMSLVVFLALYVKSYTCQCDNYDNSKHEMARNRLLYFVCYTLIPS